MKTVKHYIFGDPRRISILNHGLLLIVGILFFNLQRNAIDLAFTILCAVITELLLSRVFKENKSFIDRFKSALVTALGIIILVHMKEWWQYGFAAFLAISSKYLIRKDPKNHIFNPSNFAIVAIIALFPEFNLAVYPGEFTQTYLPTIQVILLGAIVVTLVKRWPLVFSYIGGLVISGAILQWLNVMDFYFLFLPEVGFIGLLFIFFMITDPKTSPSNRQWLFGVLLAVTLSILKVFEVYAGFFVALFLLTSVWRYIEIVVDRLAMVSISPGSIYKFRLRRLDADQARDLQNSYAKNI